MLNTPIGVGKRTALRLEDGAYTLVGRDHVEADKESVVCQHNDALRGREACWKLAARVVVSSLHASWSSAWGVVTQVGAEVRPDVIEPEE
jgi:hypothetical protein